MRRFLNLKKESYDVMDTLEAEILESYFGEYSPSIKTYNASYLEGTYGSNTKDGHQLIGQKMANMVNTSNRIATAPSQQRKVEEARHNLLQNR